MSEGFQHQIKSVNRHYARMPRHCKAGQNDRIVSLRILMMVKRRVAPGLHNTSKDMKEEKAAETSFYLRGEKKRNSDLHFFILLPQTWLRP